MVEAVHDVGEPYRRPGRRRRRGPGPSFFDWSAEDQARGLCGALPLLQALKSGDMQLTQGLLLAKADPNAERDEIGRTALNIAAEQGLAGVCRHLVRGMADLEAPALASGFTALHLAVVSGHMVVLKLLVELRACVNSLSFSLDTPLSVAVSDGNIEAMKWLLKSRAQVDPKLDGLSPPPLGHSEESNVVFSDTCPPGGFPWVTSAAHAGSNSRPPSAPSSVSVLMRAAQRNAQKEVIEELVAAGCELDVRDEAFNQPLHHACKNNSTRVARLLLDRRADPNSSNKEFRTPLHCAAGVGAPRAIRMLTERRAEVNREDQHGVTPLQLACNAVAAQTLKKLGARSVSVPAITLATFTGGTGGIGQQLPQQHHLQQAAFMPAAGPQWQQQPMAASGAPVRGSSTRGCARAMRRPPPVAVCSGAASPAAPASPGPFCLASGGGQSQCASPLLSPASTVATPFFATAANRRQPGRPGACLRPPPDWLAP